MRKPLLSVGLVATLGLTPPVASATEHCDWPMYGRDLGRTFAQTPHCSGIEPLTVSTLHPRWAVRAPDSVTASPAVADGVVYVGDWTGRFYALDAQTGEERWHFDIDDPSDTAFGRIVSSAAVTEVDGRRLVVFGGGATVYALDAATGAVAARACLDPRANPSIRCQDSGTEVEVESSPAIVEDGGTTRVLVGMDVHNDAGVGRTGLVSLRFSGGALVPEWKFDPESGASYTTDASKDGEPGFVVTDDPLTFGAGTGEGCGGVWSSPAVDRESGLVFFGTASCSRDGPTSGESMFAIRLDSGALVWTETPLVERGEGTRLDDDFGASPNLLPGGLVGFAGKDGWYYARHRATGAEAWSAHPGQAGHVTTDFAVGGTIGSPAVGTVNDEDAVFVTTALSTLIDRPFDEGGPDPDERLVTEDPGRMLSLHALRARDGAILWRTPVSRQSYGAPSFVNGVVLVPSTFDLSLKAFHADTGALLWESPLLGAPSSTAVVVGDSVYLGTGTRTTDAEFKAFGDEPGEFFGSIAGAHALSPASSITAFQLAP